MTSSLQRAIAFSVLTSLVASLVAAGSKQAAHYVTVHVVIFSQYLVGFCLYMPLLFKRGRRAFETQRLGLHVLRGLAGLGAFYAYYSAILHVSLVDATLLRNSAPLLVPLLALWFLGVRVSSVDEFVKTHNRLHSYIWFSGDLEDQFLAICEDIKNEF